MNRIFWLIPSIACRVYLNGIAIIITYDDSGDWYDHVLPPTVSQSNDPINDGRGIVRLCGHALDGF
jgi:phospholipase C